MQVEELERSEGFTRGVGKYWRKWLQLISDMKSEDVTVLLWRLFQLQYHKLLLPVKTCLGNDPLYVVGNIKTFSCRRCWLSDMKGIQPVLVRWLSWFDCSFACLFDSSCHLHLRHPCSDKIPNGGILALAYPGCPGNMAVQRVVVVVSHVIIEY